MHWLRKNGGVCETADLHTAGSKDPDAPAAFVYVRVYVRARVRTHLHTIAETEPPRVFTRSSRSPIRLPQASAKAAFTPTNVRTSLPFEGQVFSWCST